MKWADVFKKAIVKAKELMKKNANLKYPQAVKLAWKSDEIKKLKADYDKQKAGKGELCEGGAHKRTVRKRVVRKRVVRRKVGGAHKKRVVRKRVVRRKVGGAHKKVVKRVVRKRTVHRRK